MKIIGILSEKKSNNNQVISLAKRISEKTKTEVVFKKIIFTNLIKLPNFITKFIPTWMMIKYNEGFVDVDNCSIIVSCGKSSSRYATYLKNNTFPDAKIVQILKPNQASKSIDAILIPKHEKITKEHDKTFFFNGTLVCHKTLNEEIEQKTSEMWLQDLMNKNKLNIDDKFFGVLIGGSSKYFNFESEEMAKFIQKLNDISHTTKTPLVIATRKSTPSTHVKILRKHIRGKHAIYCYKENDGEKNPYLGILKNAEVIITTGDSIPIMSEAIEFNKPLYLNLDGIKTKRQKMFISNIIENGQAKRLPSDNKIEIFKVNNLNNIDDIVSELLAKIYN